MRFAGAFVRYALIAGLSLAKPAAAAETDEPRLLVLAVDGAGYEMVGSFLREGALPNFARIRDEGAFTDGMVTAFPSRTAPSFAMIWTGLSGRDNGITGNSLLALPAAEHSLLETRDGFSAEALRADPLWVRAVRGGRRAAAIHTTHTFPLAGATRRLSAEERERLFLLTGYGAVWLAPETLNEERNPLLSEPAVVLPGLTDAASFRFVVGESDFVGVFHDDPANPESGWDTFSVLADDAADAPVLLARVGVGPDAVFSAPIGAEGEGGRVDFQVRAFAAEPPTASTAARFTVFRSGASTVAIHPDRAWRDRLGEPWWPRTIGAPEYASGRLGEPATGTATNPGPAETRLVEIVSGIADAALAQLEAAATMPDWNLIALYLPMADEAGHLLHGRLDERLPSHDAELAARLRPALLGAFEQVDRVLGRMFALAEASGAHLMLVSDHGMAGVDRRVHLNAALESAGLLAFAEDGSVNLAGTKALLLPTGDGSVGLNRTARPGGIVPPEEEEDALEAAREALLAIEADGEPVITGFLEPAGDGAIRPGGDTTGDLFPVIRPGFLISSAPSEELVTPTRAAGAHGYLPTRRDMLAVLAVWGPRIAPATEWPRASALDVTPTALDLLGLPPDASLPGRSLLGSAPLVRPGGTTSGGSR